MEDLTTVLLAHEARYPLMGPADAVKLIYQNEFGPGHMIRDENACLEFLRREYAGVKKDPRCPLYEDIGNGINRVHLAALEPGLLEDLGQAFLRCAGSHQGNIESFLEKLKILRTLTDGGHFSFSPEQLSQYLHDYEKAGFPALSHSWSYREAYHPAYRIISGRLDPFTG